MNFFSIEDILIDLGLDPETGIEELDFEAMSVVAKNGDRILCWYRQVDDHRAVLGTPFKVTITPDGELDRIMRLDLMSDELFYVVSLDTLMMVSPMGEDWVPRFEDLVDKTLSRLEGRVTLVHSDDEGDDGPTEVLLEEKVLH